MGTAHTASVVWGDFAAYTHNLAPHLPGGLLDAAVWVATAAESLLGLTLPAGVAVRWSARAGAALLLVFAVSMALFLGWEAPLSASVFAAAAAVPLPALSPVHAFASASTVSSQRAGTISGSAL
ncbi:hypothetical protein [Amycolatopsis sp. FDAARGOS 1241]|uniref:hypothetical protein n=1 Tax=Amycolatopsis sp. FDAARGOS 1241 TaxID=2778070 RepID=UPI00195208B7|nr:hypothetical protein [Amycolatopsis sp. FDAARGOS 1241]QRP50436.1 hypothetical protein I6J71_23755 [Amycolatopsis sp. FDAARGOS 1241]